jgi:hypothetical protein
MLSSLGFRHCAGLRASATLQALDGVATKRVAVARPRPPQVLDSGLQFEDVPADHLMFAADLLPAGISL